MNATTLVGAAVPGLKARANPSRCQPCRADSAWRPQPAPSMAVPRSGLALPLQGREPQIAAARRRAHGSVYAASALRRTYRAGWALPLQGREQIDTEASAWARPNRAGGSGPWPGALIRPTL
jgi:hypothetical protein